MTIQQIKDVRSPLLNSNVRTATNGIEDFHRVVQVRDADGKFIRESWAINSQLSAMAALQEDGFWTAKAGYKADADKVFVIDKGKGEESSEESPKKETQTLPEKTAILSVSYTHLTLPTISDV